MGFDADSSDDANASSEYILSEISIILRLTIYITRKAA